ncbi:hypothetical protein [Dactylosporangium sp. NPDC000521]|uniref:hypothetical protein n=1 Tax=Dactylosporangium sp. NPDC000521 TaxID=3363975 RepID=UPI0036AC3FD0
MTLGDGMAQQQTPRRPGSAPPSTPPARRDEQQRGSVQDGREPKAAELVVDAAE